MLAPLAASLLRYGACLITLERCLFSKITTTMWSGRGTAAFSFLGAGGRTAGCGISGDGSTPASGVGSTAGCGISGVGSTPASGVGSTPASGVGSTPASGLVGAACTTTVGKLLGIAGATFDDGSPTAQAADVNSKIPAAAQPDRGKT